MLGARLEIRYNIKAYNITKECLLWRRKMYYFIMNPKASSGKGMKAWKTIEGILKEENVEYESHVLKSAQETTEFVRNLTSRKEYITAKESLEMVDSPDKSESDCHIVVLGGDGTINAVLNGIADFDHTILSCIRTGSGNDFARNVGVKKDVRKAMNHLLHSTQQLCLDYGEATYIAENGTKTRRFAISNGVGYDADICEEVGRSRLKKILNWAKLGKLVYVAIGIKQIFTRKNSGAVVTLDDKKLKISSLFFVVGMIHEKEGGGVPFCPNADATDGLLDVCLVKQMPKLKLLLAVIMVYMKQHYRFRDITAYRCKSMKVELDTPQWFHMDGETSVKIREIRLECHSGLRFYK